MCYQEREAGQEMARIGAEGERFRSGLALSIEDITDQQEPATVHAFMHTVVYQSDLAIIR